MASTVQINNVIQETLVKMKIEEIQAVEMARILDQGGVLKDSTSRPGLPLRNYLRNGRIIGSYQYPNGRWVIRKVETEKRLTVEQAAKELGITKQALYKRIEKNKIQTEMIGETISIPVSAINKSGGEEAAPMESIPMEVPNHMPADIVNTIMKEVSGIYFEIENLNTRIHRLEDILKKYLNII